MSLTSDDSDEMGGSFRGASMRVEVPPPLLRLLDTIIVCAEEQRGLSIRGCSHSRSASIRGLNTPATLTAARSATWMANYHY